MYMLNLYIYYVRLYIYYYPFTKVVILVHCSLFLYWIRKSLILECIHSETRTLNPFCGHYRDVMNSSTGRAAAMKEHRVPEQTVEAEIKLLLVTFDTMIYSL